MKSSNYLRQAKRRTQQRPDRPEPTWQDKIVGKPQLIAILNIKRAELDIWIKEGMPIICQGSVNKEWEFDLVAVKAWAKSNDRHFDE